MESTIVIKVKYGETLRRFNASIVNGKLVLDMVGLRVKVLHLFNFAPNAEFTLTYIDEDGDKITLADEEDLHDVVRQSLNPLRITVQLNAEKSGRTYAQSSGNSTPTPTSSPEMQPPLNSSVFEILNQSSRNSTPTPTRSQPPLNPRTCEILNRLSRNSTPTPTRSPTLNSSVFGILNAQNGARTCARSSGNSTPTPTSAKAITEVPNLKDSQVLPKDLSKMGLTLEQVEESSAGAQSSPKSRENKETKASTVKVDPSAKAITEVPNLKDSQVLNISEVGIGRGIKVSAMPPSVSVDLNVKIPDDHLSGLPDVLPNVNVPLLNKEKKRSTECPPGGMCVGLGASGDSSGSHVGLNRVSECPFAGTVVANDSAFPHPHHYAPLWAPFMGSYAPQYVGTGSIFHTGVQCDGCGAHPITGPRFKSKVKDDYDLCNVCFAEQGNEADYTIIDRPVTLRKPFPLMRMYEPHSRVRRHTVRPSQVITGPGMKGGWRKLDSRFIQDVNILDGTIMGPSTSFTKIWRMKNNGTVVWPHGTHLMWIEGDRLSNAVSVELEIPTDGLPVEKELDVAIDFCAPELPGQYISYWRMASPSGQKFGQRVWVLIQVDASLRDPRLPNTCGFNLNLPPTSGSINAPQIVNVDVEPMIKNSPAEPENSNKGTKLVEPLFDAYPNKDQELNFPINDTLLVGGGASNAKPAEASSSVSYPVVDFSEVEPIVHFTEPSPAGSNVPVPTAPAQWEGGNNEVEQKLLRELDEMGFKQADLNKEILRMNEYNLQQSVDDLCDVAEWDPILDELKEMGFCDDEVNKRLLKKNNGSIKRVVMDLINGEKA